MAITLANIQSALVASELALSLALQAHIAPSITSSANLSTVTTTTSSPPARTYWWTHDITTNLFHTSATCSTKSPEHQDDATEENKMGGATFFYRPRTCAWERGPIKGHYKSVANNVTLTKQQLNITIPLTPSPPIVIDTGATCHYLQAHGDPKNTTPIQQNISVSLPDGTIITSTHTTTLPMPPEMSKGYNFTHIFPALKHSSLLSVRQICYHSCNTHFDATTVTINHNWKTMLTGKRSHNTIGKLCILDPYTPKLEPDKEQVTGFINAALNQEQTG
jgi:hypothetical protein